MDNFLNDLLASQINPGNTTLHCFEKSQGVSFFFSTEYVLRIPGMTSERSGLVSLCSLWIIYVGGRGAAAAVHVCISKQVCWLAGASSILIRSVCLFDKFSANLYFFDVVVF